MPLAGYRALFLPAVALAVVILAPVRAADSTGPAEWSAGQFDGMKKQIAATMGDAKFGMAPLVSGKNYTATTFYREVGGQAETHATTTEFLFIRGGEPTIVVGGKMVNAKPSGPGEIRADKIEGGTPYKMHAGDMIYIPATTPHQVLVEKGQTINAIAVKVESPR